MNPTLLINLINVTITILKNQELIAEKLSGIKSRVEDMVKEGRNPTQAEWDALNEELAKSTAILQDRAEEARRMLGRADS